MLKLHYGVPDESIGRIVYNPDSYFSHQFRNMEVIETDFGERVLKKCSMIDTVFNRGSLLTTMGTYISPDKLSSGAKNLLIMKATDCVCNMLWCGDNCNEFVAEIAKERDLILYSTRLYIPFDECDLDSVLVLNNNKEYTDDKKLLHDLIMTDYFGHGSEI